MEIRCAYAKLVLAADLKPHPKNRNKHPEEQIERLAQILEYQGWRRPITVSNQTGFITSGHGRLAAAIKNGWPEVPVDFQDYESEEQEYADVQADNAIALWAELDLSGINADIGDLGPDFDLELLGIRNFEIDVADKGMLTHEDAVPEPPKEPKSKRGDVYRLGAHRVMCGDATSIDDLEKLLAGRKADMVFTDPPYNTGMSAKVNSGSTWLSHMFDDSFTDEEWEALLSGMCSNYWIAMKEDSVAYVCLDWRRSHELVPHLKRHFHFSNLIVWDKVVHGLGSDYKYTHELIHVVKKGKPKLDTNHGEQDYQDVWRIQRKIGRDEDHATKKPLELVERALTHASSPGDMVLDLFGGSGSTLLAAEKKNRVGYLMELSPAYVDVIVQRWENATGEKAELVE